MVIVKRIAFDYWSPMPLPPGLQKAIWKKKSGISGNVIPRKMKCDCTNPLSNHYYCPQTTYTAMGLQNYQFIPPQTMTASTSSNSINYQPLPQTTAFLQAFQPSTNTL